MRGDCADSPAPFPFPCRACSSCLPTRGAGLCASRSGAHGCCHSAAVAGAVRACTRSPPCLSTVWRTARAAHSCRKAEVERETRCVSFGSCVRWLLRGGMRRSWRARRLFACALGSHGVHPGFFSPAPRLSRGERLGSVRPRTAEVISAAPPLTFSCQLCTACALLVSLVCLCPLFSCLEPLHTLSAFDLLETYSPRSTSPRSCQRPSLKGPSPASFLVFASLQPRCTPPVLRDTRVSTLLPSSPRRGDSLTTSPSPPSHSPAWPLPSPPPPQLFRDEDGTAHRDGRRVRRGHRRRGGEGREEEGVVAAPAARVVSRGANTRSRVPRLSTAHFVLLAPSSSSQAPRARRAHPCPC